MTTEILNHRTFHWETIKRQILKYLQYIKLQFCYQARMKFYEDENFNTSVGEPQSEVVLKNLVDYWNVYHSITDFEFFVASWFWIPQAQCLVALKQEIWNKLVREPIEYDEMLIWQQNFQPTLTLAFQIINIWTVLTKSIWVEIPDSNTWGGVGDQQHQWCFLSILVEYQGPNLLHPWQRSLHLEAWYLH